MDLRIRRDGNVRRLQSITMQLNSIEHQKSQLIEDARRIEGEQRLLDELIKEGGNEQKSDPSTSKPSK